MNMNYKVKRGKRIYRCRLIEFVPLPNARFVALIRLLEPERGHRLPGITRTMLIININFVLKEIETLNSIYKYGEE